MRTLARHYLDQRGVASLEFAIIAPVIIVVLIMFYDVANVVISRWQITAAADAIARIATAMATTPSGTNILSDDQARIASTAIFGAMPFLLQTSPTRYAVAITSVVTSPNALGCAANCTYGAKVAWSMALQGVAVRRACGMLNSMPDGLSPAANLLPTGAFTSAPILVVDVSYQYVPVLLSLFGSGIWLSEAVYMGTRIGGDAEWVHITGPLAAAAQCPGYAN